MSNSELYGKQEGMLNPIDKADLPLQTFHLDHLGPLITTKKGYKYILVVIDGFTKFTWIYPKKTLATEEVVSKIESQKKIFGNPKRIVTDRGTALTSGKFVDYCQKETI